MYGFPVELETDCIALRDTLMSNKLNSTHARWRDGILAHHITDVRHRPGITNTAADSLSRQFTGTPKRNGDGHQESVNPDWESQRGLVNDVWTVDSEGAAQGCISGWMCQFAGTERQTGDGHEWSIGDSDPVECTTATFAVEFDDGGVAGKRQERAIPVFEVGIGAGMIADTSKPPDQTAPANEEGASESAAEANFLKLPERAIPIADAGISPGVFELDNSMSVLRERFTDEPIFLQVVDAFLDLDYDKPARDKRRARHRAIGYQLDGGRLWRIGDGRTT